jgi:uncharacterized protein (DUF58 family)
MLNFFREKLKKSSRPRKIYIIPTLDGLKLLSLNITLLIIGLVYGNNFVLLFNFILFGLFICSMFYTHFNLDGLKLEMLYLSPTFAGDKNNLHLFIKTSSSLGHHYINLNLDSKLVQTEDAVFSSDESDTTTIKAEIKIKAIKRGVETIQLVRLETLFPFHLFRCISYHPCNLEIIVYPETNNQKLFLETRPLKDETNEPDDFTLRNFEQGDSYSRVDWKKLAQKNIWYTKITTKININPVILQLGDHKAANIEQQISSLATQMRVYQASETPYGLYIISKNEPAQIIAPSLSLTHLNRCLRVLAQYEY